MTSGPCKEKVRLAAARTGLPVCLMHMQNQPQNMQKHPKYTNIEEEILEFLINRKKACVEASISPEKILFDPGFGFGKIYSIISSFLERFQNLYLLDNQF